MNVASATSPGNRPAPDGAAFRLVSSAEMLQSKVNVCLTIMGQTMPMLLDPTGEFESDHLRAKYDGGCADAAQVTYIKACDRLDQLLQDERNWKVHAIDNLIKKRTKVLHETELEIANQRLSREQYFNRPSIRAGATLYRRGTKFFAVLGDQFDNESIFGEGATPAAAFENLDAILISLDPPEQKLPKKK